MKDFSSRDPQVSSLFSDFESEGQPSAPSAEPIQTGRAQVSDESACGRLRWRTVRIPSAPSAGGPAGDRPRPSAESARPSAVFQGWNPWSRADLCLRRTVRTVRTVFPAHLHNFPTSIVVST